MSSAVQPTRLRNYNGKINANGENIIDITYNFQRTIPLKKDDTQCIRYAYFKYINNLHKIRAFFVFHIFFCFTLLHFFRLYTYNFKNTANARADPRGKSRQTSTLNARERAQITTTD